MESSDTVQRRDSGRTGASKRLGNSNKSAMRSIVRCSVWTRVVVVFACAAVALAGHKGLQQLPPYCAVKSLGLLEGDPHHPSDVELLGPGPAWDINVPRVCPDVVGVVVRVCDYWPIALEVMSRYSAHVQRVWLRSDADVHARALKQPLVSFVVFCEI